MRQKMCNRHNNLSGCNAMMAATHSESFAGAIRREYGPLRHAPKILARKSGASPRAAETWLSGKHAPSFNQLIPLLANCEALMAELHRLIEAERENKCRR